MGKTKRTVSKVLGDRERVQVREGSSKLSFPESARIFSVWCGI